jgi:uncharacterized membrane protein YkvA (DUF1232 family)
VPTGENRVARDMQPKARPKEGPTAARPAAPPPVLYGAPDVGRPEYEEDIMPLRFVVEISDSDLEYYRQVLEETAKRTSDRDEADLVRTTRMLMEKARRSGLSSGVEKRLDDLCTLVAMLEDRDWALEGEDRRRIQTVMSYFSDTLDVIPDEVPGLGYVDDALMMELILRELREDLDGYRDFCAFRAQQEELLGEQARVNREDWLAAKRRQMLLRIKRRRDERRRHGSRAAPTPALLAFRT